MSRGCKVPTEDMELIEAGENFVEPEQNPRRLRRAWAVPLTILAVAAVALGVMTRSPHPKSVQADVQSNTELDALAMAAAMADGLMTGAKLVKDAQSGQQDLAETFEKLGKPATEAKKQALAEKLPANVSAKLMNLHGQALLGDNNNRNDGNVCPDDEEHLGGLCYKPCAELTDGEYPIRTTAFSCCREEPCSFFNSKFTNPIYTCSGLDVSGTKEGTRCPHPPGDCLTNEEYCLGVCYKKCALLTNNTFPWRAAADSCCRYHNHIACLDPSNKLASPDYNVGGGVGDAELEEEYGQAHQPVPALAEVQTTTTLLGLP